MREIKHSIKYELFRFLTLIACIFCMFVLVIESLTPGNKSARKSNAVGNVIGGFINDLGGDQAKEIEATSCLIKMDNDKRSFSVGESTNLNVLTTPLDSNQKSYDYISLDEDIATISKTGLITFHKSGSVKIKVINVNNEKVFDEIMLEVKDIYPINFNSNILNADYIDSEISYYELEKNKTYNIKNDFDPDNSTVKNVTYTISDDTFLKIENDTINTLEVSDSLISIRIKTTNDIENVIYVKIVAKEIKEELISLESIISYDIEKYVDYANSFTPTIKYNPSYTSNECKGYILESLDESIATIIDNKIVLTGIDGICQIKIISTYDNSIYTTINLNVKKRSNVESFDVNYSMTMYVGDSQTLSIKNIKPYDAILNKPYFFKSLDESVIEITNNGTIKAISTGTCEIVIKVIDSNNNEIEKTITITVSLKEIYSVDDFDINYKLGLKPVLYLNERTNLNNYFGISNYYNNNESITPENKNYYFSFDDNSAIVDGNYITLKEYGLISGYIYYKNSDETYVYKKIELYSISKFKVLSSSNLDNYNLNVGSYVDFEIVDDYLPQIYDIKVNGTSIKLRTNNKYFRVTASDAGKSIITISPNYEKTLTLNSFKGLNNDLNYTISFNVTDIYTKSLDIKFKDNDSYIEYIDNYTLYINKEYSYEEIVDSTTTKYRINVNDNGLIERKFNTFIPRETGLLKMEFIDELSNIKREYNFKVRNVISVDSNTVYNIKGSYNYKDGKIEIINGNTLNINLAFTSDSTYKVTNYKSTDEKIIKVYEDGTIEPKRSGEASIILSINDGYEYKEYTVDFVVHKKNVIDNMSQFMKYIRKGLGHFGAFLILAIFSTISFALFFRGKLFFIGIAINFLFGFLFAGLTEYLQTLTPQRVGCMSDILIDYSGFISSAITISIIFTIIFSIKFFKNRNKKDIINNEVDMYDTRNDGN